MITKKIVIDKITRLLQSKPEVLMLTDNELKKAITENIYLYQINCKEVSKDEYLFLTAQNFSERASLEEDIFNSIRGLSIIDKLLADNEVTEIMINGYSNIFVEKNGELKKFNDSFISEEKLLNIITKFVAKSGKSVSTSNPIVDTRLEDGSRVNVVLPPVSLTGPIVTIRRFPDKPIDINNLIDNGSISVEAANFLEVLVKARYNIFVCGGTGSGKTTFLNVLSNFIPKNERIITIEDSAELQLNSIDNLVRLEVRSSASEHSKNIDIRDLIKTSLRMRPERIIVGEVRGGEALDMLQAMNTGHDGSLSTGHANSALDMFSRLETMVLSNNDNLPLIAVRKQIVNAIDIIIFLSRQRDHSRKVIEISEVIGLENNNVKLNVLYEFKEDSRDSCISKVVGSLNKTNNSLINTNKLKKMGYTNATNY